MKSPFSRMLVVLAASEMRLADIYSFFRWARQMDPSTLTEMVDDVRRDLQKYDGISRRSSAYSRYPENKKVSPSRLEEMLLNETGLSKSEAVHMLLLELRSGPRSAKTLPAYNKVSFEKWLRRISESVGAETLLTAASRIRNRVVHKDTSHWPLRRD